jgi:hypothetical protein
MRFARHFLSPALFVLIGLSTAVVAKAAVYLINTANFAGNQNFGPLGGVTEPASMILLGSGLMGLAAGIRKRRSQKN